MPILLESAWGWEEEQAQEVMPRRRSTAPADEAAAALGTMLMNTPFWVGPLLAFGVFIFLSAVGPAILAAGPGQAGVVFAQLCHKLAPLGAFLVLVIWVGAEVKKRWRRRLLDSRSGIDSLRELTWQRFELLVGEAYRRKGYAVEETGQGGADGGVDLVLTRGGERVLVQCKRWRTWKVGVETVRALYGVVTAEGADRGIVVSCGRFTKDAQAFARDKPIELVDGPTLNRLLEAVRGGQLHVKAGGKLARSRPAVGGVSSLTSAARTPTCPRCGAAMVLRTAKRGPRAGSRFYGCSTFPRCRGTREA